MRKVRRKPASASAASKLAAFTLIELILLIATAAIFLTLFLPVYTNYSVRTKVAKALSVADAVQAAVSAACLNDPVNGFFSEKGRGIVRPTEAKDSLHIDGIQVTGSCAEPVISMTTFNSGHIPDPTLTLVGSVSAASDTIEWRCFSRNTPNWLLPAECRD